MTAAELTEQGIRAYGRGQLGEAERCWRDALALEPGHPRALSYLELLVGKLAQGAAAPRGVGAPVPLPAPGMVARAATPAQRTAPGGPVPLPAPVPSWPSAAPAGSGHPAAPPRQAGGRAAAPGGGRLPGAGAGSTLPGHPGFGGTRPDAPGERASVPLAAPAWGARPGSAAPGATHATPAPASWPALDAAAPSSDDRTTLSAYAPSPWEEGPVATPTVVLGDEGVGLDLASVEEQPGLHALVPEPAAPPSFAPSSRGRSEVELWMEGARELFALGDFSGSLEMIEKILHVDPAHAEARQYLAQNEATLTAMYESKLGPQDAVPRLAIQPEEVMWLNLDHRAGFLLAQVDGTVTYEDLFALSGLPRLDTARILATLLQEGVIGT